MFTIRHVEDDGHDSLREAKTVWRDPRAAGCVDAERPVFADVGEEHALGFVTGKVYVMNGAGKTVATYYLANAPLHTQEHPPHEFASSTL